MTQAKPGTSSDVEKVKPRDWIILPLLGLLTIVAIVSGVMLATNHLFKVSKTSMLSCLILTDPTTGVRAIPNSVCRQKAFETDLTEFKFNNCGDRTVLSCGPKPPGTYRVVLVGSSFAEGVWVPMDKTFGALLPAELSSRTGRKIEVYDEAINWGTPHALDLRFKQVLASEPDMILWALTPWDIENASVVLPVVPTFEAQKRKAANIKPEGRLEHWHKTLIALRGESATAGIRDGWIRLLKSFQQAPTGQLLQHYIYKSQTQYLEHYLMQGEPAAFLRSDLSPTLRQNLALFDKYVADLEAESKAAGVPLVVTLLPQRAQAAMISKGDWAPGFDPYKLGNQIRTIVESHGGTYVDVLHDFRGVPNPEQYYYPVDGHIDAAAHKIISGMLAKELTSGAVPSLDAQAQANNRD